MILPKLSKAEKRAYAELQPVLEELEAVQKEMYSNYERLKWDVIPDDWFGIDRRVAVRPHKVRITASYDADIARFFRTMGHGYQARMNAVLRAYMLAVVSRAIPSEKNRDWMGNEI